MTLLADSPVVDSPSPALTDASRVVASRERKPRNKASAPPGEDCLRCGGLLIPSYTTALDRDFTGKPVTVWRCVNCGDCLDAQILANRRKDSGPAPPRTRLPRGPQQTGRPRGVETGMR